MQPRRSCGGEALRGREGVASLDRDLLAPAFEQPHDAAFEDIDRGVDQHVSMLT